MMAFRTLEGTHCSCLLLTLIILLCSFSETPAIKPVTDAPFAARRRDAWKVIGPGGGGAQFNPTISPHDPKKVFVSCDMTGAYFTNDGGNSWRMFNLRGVVDFFVFDPVNPQVVYARSLGLWRSTDGGIAWQLVYPDPSKVRTIVKAGDHAEERIVAQDGSQDLVQALAVDPADSKSLYAVFVSRGRLNIRVSKDWGKTWKEGGNLNGGGKVKIYVDPRSPGNDRTLFVISSQSIDLREHGIWSHLSLPEGAKTLIDFSVGFPSQDGKVLIYAVSGSNWRARDNAPAGIFVSSDGGRNWEKTDPVFLTKAPKGSAQLQLRAVAACGTKPDIAYLSFRDLSKGLSSGERSMGVVKTIDKGKSWNFVWKDSEERAAGNVKDAWINDRFGPGWGENPFDLDVASTNPDICYGTDFGRTMRTLDGGKTWEGVYSKQMPDGSYSTTGLDVTTSYYVHFDPFGSNRVFISYTDIGLFLSENGGAGWTSVTARGVPHDWQNTTYWIEFDPEVKGRMWAAMSGIHDLPRPKMWREHGVSNYDGGVCISEDGGKSWKGSDAGINQAAVTHILLDPSTPAGKRTLYICAFGKGVFKSVDNGRTWTLKNSGIQGKEPFAWHLTRVKDGTLYLVVARRSEDGSIGNANDGALYRSTDGAEHWKQLALPRGCNGPTHLEVDPADQNRFCLSAWGRKNNTRSDEGGGVYISSDAGRTWRSVMSHDQHVHDITIDSRNHVYYACGFESSAYRSADRGETWTRIKGFNFKWGRQVVPDPRNPDRIFVTTFGGSVWYGPAAGDPKAMEDIVTPVGRYGAD